MSSLLQDLRYGIRSLRNSPGFTLVAVLALALGIGANTAIFSVVNSVLIRPLPYRDADRLMVLWEKNTREGWDRVGVSGPTFLDWKEQATLFEDMSLHEPGTGTLTGLGEPEQFPGLRVSTNFFRNLGARAQLGRLFNPQDANGRHDVAVITDGFWRRRMGADPGAVGRVYQVDGLPYTIVGVLPPDFWLPIPAEGFVPWWSEALRGRPRTDRSYGVIGRLKPGVTVDQARAQMEAISRRIAERNVAMRNWGVTMVPLKEALVQTIRPALLVLLGAVGFVLLIACTNLANLLLARSTARHKEIAIRVAIGAPRMRLVRQLLTESLLLGLAGGALGLLLGVWGVDVLSRVLPAQIPIEGSSTGVALARLTVDWRVLVFTLLASLATGVLFGLAPAVVSSAANAMDAMKERSSSAARHGRLRGALVIAEVSLALVLLTGAGLLMRSFVRMQESKPGFRPGQVLTVEMELPTDTRYRGRQERPRVFQRFLRAVETLPGVQAAALTHIVPLTDYEDRTSFEIEGRSAVTPGQRMEADYRVISPNYFRALNIPLLRGRDFTAHDGEGDKPPCYAIIDQALARPYFANEDPVGRRLRFANFNNTSCEIVGVAGAVKHAGLNRQPRPTIYFPYLIAGQARMSLVLRTSGDPAGFVNAVKRAVWSVDPDQPVYNIKTMDELLADSASAPRFTLLLLGVFAAAALLLAAVGIYGVLSYSVTRRSREIGIRIALGASSRCVLGDVLKEACALVAAGLAIGVVAALALTRVLASLLYGVSATDVPTFAAVSGLLAFVAVAAAYLPARRATRVEPIVALRYE
jgi:putative ABC transport system permease protein